MDETGHSGDAGAADGGIGAESHDRALVNGWAARESPWSNAGSALDPETDVPAWRRPGTEIRPFTQERPFPARPPAGEIRPFTLPPPPPSFAPAPGPDGQQSRLDNAAAPRWSDSRARYQDLLAHLSPNGSEPRQNEPPRAAEPPRSEPAGTEPPREPPRPGPRPAPRPDLLRPDIPEGADLRAVNGNRPASAPPFPYEGDLDDARLEPPRSQAGQQRAAVPAERPFPAVRPATPGGRRADWIAAESARHALDPPAPTESLPTGAQRPVAGEARSGDQGLVRPSYDPSSFPRRLPYEPADTTSGYAQSPAFPGRLAGDPGPGGTGEQSFPALPQRVPAQPDVPAVPEPPSVEPPAETPALARIAKHLRRGDVLSAQERQEGFDVKAILAAVREVEGVRDASLRSTPAGAHSLRLDLSEGADPAEVSRQVARLLQDRMGLDAAMKGASPLGGSPPPAPAPRSAPPGPAPLSPASAPRSAPPSYPTPPSYPAPASSSSASASAPPAPFVPSQPNPTGRPLPAPPGFPARPAPDEADARPPDQFGSRPAADDAGLRPTPDPFGTRAAADEAGLRSALDQSGLRPAPDEAESRPGQFGSRSDQFGSRPDEFRPDEFRSRPDEFRPDEFRSRRDQFGLQSAPDEVGERSTRDLFGSRPDQAESRSAQDPFGLRPTQDDGGSRPAPDRSAPDRSAPDRSAPDRSAPDRSAPDRLGPDRVGPDRSASDRLGQDLPGPRPERFGSRPAPGQAASRSGANEAGSRSVTSDLSAGNQPVAPRPLDVGERPGPRVMIENVRVDTFGTEATVEVRLAVNDRIVAGEAAGPAVDGYLLRLCAMATAGAVDELLTASERADGPVKCFVEHAAAVPFGSMQVAVVVLLLSVGGWVEQLSGSAVITGDDRHAMVCATLAAVNRRLEALLS